jgi:hypothetical protein
VIQRGAHRAEVDVDRVLHVRGIAARHGDRDAGAGRSARAQHGPVTLGQRVLRDPQPAEAVALPRIGTRHIEDDVRLVPQCGRQALPDRSQVHVVTSTIRQRDVERALLLVEGVVADAVHREREDVAVAREQRRRAVALVHVAVDDRTPAGAAFRLHRTDCDGYIVEHTETLAERGVGMMGAPRQVDGGTLAEGGSRRGDGRADGTA